VILTIIGITSITTTGIENRMAGFGRTGEGGTSAAESCMQTAVKIIQQTIDNGSLPATFLDNANPAGPVPNGNSATLQAEIMGQSDNNADAADAAPNMVATIDNFTARGDIDRLYAVPKAGGSLQFAGGYEGTAGGSAGGGVDIMYRVDCTATNTATSTRSRITAIYACTATGETCQKKI
jgi:Tfp pilus assembly protein PilX